MPDVIGVRFHGVGKAYNFDTNGLKIRAGDTVIVQTVNGLEIGMAAGLNRYVEAADLNMELKPIVRKADRADLATYAENTELEKEAYKICRDEVARYGLDMNVVNAEYTFDRKKLVFYFTSEGRVDFRELVKGLAQIFHVRIELRQVGVRDEARMIGGLGICGRELCCASFMQSFNPVSIKMAKEQGLSMNPAKISGCCGRLMCCLQYEHSTYKEAKRGLPAVKSTIDTPDGRGRVVSQNILKEEVCVVLEGDESRDIRIYTKADLGIEGCRCPRRLKQEQAEFAAGPTDRQTSSGGEENSLSRGEPTEFSPETELTAASASAPTTAEAAPAPAGAVAEIRKELVLGKAGRDFIPGPISLADSAPEAGRQTGAPGWHGEVTPPSADHRSGDDGPPERKTEGRMQPAEEGRSRSRQRDDDSRTDRDRRQSNNRESFARSGRRRERLSDRQASSRSRQPQSHNAEEAYFGKKKRRKKSDRTAKRRQGGSKSAGGRPQSGFRPPRPKQGEEPEVGPSKD